VTHDLDPIARLNPLGGFFEPGSLPEFGLIRERFRRAARRKDFRALVIVCQSDHQLIEVFRSGDCHVLLGMVPELAQVSGGEVQRKWISSHGESNPDPFAPQQQADVRRRSRVQRAVYLDHFARDAFPAQCECSGATVPVAWIRQQMAAGRRRAVAVSHSAKVKVPSRRWGNGYWGRDAKW
jgi:hypothetical protein